MSAWSARDTAMNPTTSDSQSLLTLVQQACDRRSVAEIELDLLDGEKQFGRMRLIRWHDHAIYIDRPTCHGMPLELTSDVPATVHFLAGGERYSFRSRIIEECRVPLADNQTIPGFSIQTPDQAYRDERRHDFRASLGKCAEVISTLRPIDPPQECSFSARVMNISAGGMAVIAIDLNGHRLSTGNQYGVEFDLPGVNRKFSFRTQLRHLRDLSGAGYIMGLKFLPDSNAAEMRHAVRQISQFVAKQLKKH